MFAPFGLQHPIRGCGAQLQQLLPRFRLQSQLSKLLQPRNDLWQDGHQPFATKVIQQQPDLHQSLAHFRVVNFGLETLLFLLYVTYYRAVRGHAHSVPVIA